MGILTNQNIEVVKNYLDKQGINFQPLKEELLDHFLLDIESDMRRGSSFNEAFQAVTQQLAKHQLA